MIMNVEHHDDVSSSIGSVQHHHQQQHSLSHAYQSFLKQDGEEQAHWNDVCRAYRQYAMFVVKQFGLNHPNRIANIVSNNDQAMPSLLPLHLQLGTSEFQQRLQHYKDGAIRNQFCLDCILRHAGQPISQQQNQSIISSNDDGTVYATEAQISKVTSVLKSLARDWSVEGKKERDMSYQPILQSAQKYIPNHNNTNIGTSSNNQSTTASRKICVPGAGVGRLACELAALGYTVQGNEFSLYMLLASDFILNGPIVSVSSSSNINSNDQHEQEQPRPRPLSISPWLLETRNVHNMMDPFRTVQIPDVDPFDMVNSSYKISNAAATTSPNQSNTNTSAAASATLSNTPNIGSDFSMTAGDFTSVYRVDSEACAWDGVVSCFFFDTSPNVIEYIQVIHHMLKPGGYLINFGPLHWHWSGPSMLLTDETMSDYYDRNDHLDSKYLLSYDYCWEDLQTIIQNIGFDIIEQRTGIPAYYTTDPNSMIQTEYRCIHFVAKKK